MADPRCCCSTSPAAGVNPTLMKELDEHIERLAAERGITILLIEHDMDLVMALCDPVIVMSEGRPLARRAARRRAPRPARARGVSGGAPRARAREPVSVEGVSAGYEQMEILHDVSIEVRPGEIVTLIGPERRRQVDADEDGVRPAAPAAAARSGSTATTSPACAPSLLVRRGLSYVPQVDNVFPSLTVDENLEMGAVVRTDDIRARLEDVLALFPGLRPKRRLKAGGLSGGERQMVAMAGP